MCVFYRRRYPCGVDGHWAVVIKKPCGLNSVIVPKPMFPELDGLACNPNNPDNGGAENGTYLGTFKEDPGVFVNRPCPICARFGNRLGTSSSTPREAFNSGAGRGRVRKASTSSTVKALAKKLTARGQDLAPTPAPSLYSQSQAAGSSSSLDHYQTGTPSTGFNPSGAPTPATMFSQSQVGASSSTPAQGQMEPPMAHSGGGPMPAPSSSLNQDEREIQAVRARLGNVVRQNPFQVAVPSDTDPSGTEWVTEPFPWDAGKNTAIQLSGRARD
ncbi:hypothetical protein CC80DRAFT_548655 [Byssothecium circinans]|uniref:Uncharacterized protein n=1 Tax=Byssothecium circinans TaxID=147558 RepID=A0A6A5U5F9_9PLEO|nr:hypothetical protein CC80DRAFT_548655 [Byssothecium circinans]